MRPSLRAGLLAAVLTIVASPTALADTTVPPGGSVQQAVDAANVGDTITIQGTHAENVTVNKKLVLVGVDGAALTGTGSGSVLTVSASGVTVKTLALQSTGGAAVATTGAGGVTLSNLLFQRTGGTTGIAAIDGAGSGGVNLADVIGVNQFGPTVLLTASSANSIQRATLATTEASSDAIRMAAGVGKLVADDAILVGGAQGAGVRVTNDTSGLSAPGEITLTLRHDTITGAKNGIVLDNTPATLQQAGPITATVTSSIVHEPSVAKGSAGLPPLIPAAPVTLAFDHSDTPGVASADTNANATVTNTAGQYTADANQLFGKNLHLRADSTAIDKGAAPAGDESQTDIDGQPRVNGPSSDIGADEFYDSPPKAALTVSDANPQQNAPVTFTSTSTDPDPGDALTQYFFDFGDGSPVVTTDQPSVSHAYSAIGTYTAKLAVKDKFGAFSDVASATVKVRDGAPPVVKITAPADKSKLHLNPKAKKRRKGHKKPKQPRPLPLTILGTVSDATGVQEVDVAITYRKTAKAKTCKQYTGKAFAKAACDKLTFVKARLNGQGWQLVTRKGLRLRPGRYELRARGIDTVGNAGGTVFDAAAGSLVRVTVK